MDDLLGRFKRSPWFSPVSFSVVLHLCLVILMMFIVIPSRENPNEHLTQSFRVRGIRNLPTLKGEPGGGQTTHFSNPNKLAKQKGPNTVPVKDVSLQSLENRTIPLNKVAVEVAPKKMDLENTEALDNRDFQILLTQTQESQMRDKIQGQQRSTTPKGGEKEFAKKQIPGHEALIRILQKPLAGLNMNAFSSLAIDPEEGMPGFTPVGSGSGGGGGTGSGSPGGFPDGMLGEAKTDILKYASLDNFLDIEVLTYTDPADAPAGGGSASGGKYFMIKIFAKKDTRVFNVMPKEILFTIDCSLSISPERLNEFKRGIAYCLQNLNKDDVFNIVAFRDKAFTFSPKSVPASPQTIKQAERFVSELTSNRNTDVYSAFENIVKSPLARTPSNIILISDGRPTHGIVDSRELINSITRLNSKVRPIFAYSGGSKVNRYLLDFISYQNRGWSQFIKDRGKIHKGLGDFYGKIKDPIFLNLRYQMNGLPSEEVFPRSLPDFYRNAEFTLFGKYDSQDEFSMQLLGDVEGQTKELIFSRSLASARKGGPEIMKGYAFNKIYHLISRLTTQGQNPELLKEIQALSRRYGVTTPYSPDLETKD